MKIVVIGANGFIGNALCHSLEMDLDISMTKLTSTAPGTFNEFGLLYNGQKFPNQIDVVVYLSQSPYGSDLPNSADHMLSVNVVSVVNAAKYAIKAGASKFIYFSSGSVYRPSFKLLEEESAKDRSNWYSLSKNQAEECLELFRHEMRIIRVRPFGVFGPGQVGRLVPNLIRKISLNEPIVITPKTSTGRDGGFTTSLIYIDDLVSILKNIIYTNDGFDGPVNLASDVKLSIAQMIDLISDLIGKKAIISYSDYTRNGDFVSDNSLLHSKFPYEFSPITNAFEEVIRKKTELE